MANNSEIIFIKYEGDNFEKGDLDHEVIIQINTEGTSTEVEYQDRPELLDINSVNDVQCDNDSLPNKIEENSDIFYVESTIDDKEISSAVSSIENSKENETYNKESVLMYTCNPLNEDEINKYICKTCGLVMGCIYCLKSHYHSCHTSVGFVQYSCTRTLCLQINNGDICPKCKQICLGRDDLIEHRKIHFASCIVCPASFDTPLFLWNHCKEHHTGCTVILDCEICENKFLQLSELSDHYQSFHNMILCIVCLKRFKTQLELESHTKTHAIVLSDKLPLPFACSRCDEAFSAISELSKHLTTVHSKRKKSASKVTHESKKVMVKKEES